MCCHSGGERGETQWFSVGLGGLKDKRLERGTMICLNMDTPEIAMPSTTQKPASGEFVSGAGGQAAVGMIRLLGIAQEIVNNSTADEARNFDSAKWLGQWIERPQPALGGRKPAELIDTPTGVEVVARLLGSIESGAYQ
jgi:hypothetical protein